jgi:hypothetical protein
MSFDLEEGYEEQNKTKCGLLGCESLEFDK